MRETQQTIAQWADASFGPCKDVLSSIARAGQEMAELVKCVVEGGTVDDAVEEAADVVICLARAGEKLDYDLLQSSRTFIGEDPTGSSPTGLALAASLYLGMAALRATTGADDTLVTLLSSVRMLDIFVSAVGLDLEEVIDAKMVVNRRRQWRRDGHGHGYHIDPGAAAAVGTWADVEERQRAEERAYEQCRAEDFAEHLDGAP